MWIFRYFSLLTGGSLSLDGLVYVYNIIGMTDCVDSFFLFWIDFELLV